LVEGILDEARALEELSVVRLTVSVGNRAAEQLYSNCGFEEFGYEPHAIRLREGYVAKRHMWVGV